MATRPNQPDPTVVGVRRDTDRANSKEITVLADDIQAAESYEFKPDCVTCNGTNAQRITIPNSVIMDQLAYPTDGLDGEALAEITAGDERITARTALNPKPHRPSSVFGRQHIMQRAVDMVNARLIPFSPFGGFVKQDGLRDRPVFEQWVQRYLDELPADSIVNPAEIPIERTHEGTGEPMTGIEAPADGTMVELPENEADAGDAAIAALDEITGVSAETDVSDGYPSAGDVTEVTNWIGDDKARAQYALDIENSKSRPRKTILEHAYGVLGVDVDQAT